MLAAGCSRGVAAAGSLRSTPTARRVLMVVCGGSRGGGEDPSRLTPSHLLSGGGRAFTVLSGARQFEWRAVGKQMGGTLIVDDASHKEDVHKAVRDGNLSFGFSAGGCLFPYYIGVAGALIDGGVLTDRVKVGGASAGSLLAACLKSGMPLDQVVEQNLRLMHDLRQGGTRGRLGAVLNKFLVEHLPEDAHIKCQHQAYVAVTKITPIARPVLLSSFQDRSDLIDALMASCHIPFWLDGNAFRYFRGERHCDGGLTNFIPLPPGTVGIRVCCFPSKQLSPVYRIGISPDSFEPWDYTLRQMLQWAFEPADETIVAAMIDKGKQDAAAWMESMELTGERQQAEAREAADVGQVAAAREAAVGTSDTGVQAAAAEEGQQRLEQRAQRRAAGEAATGAGPAAPAQAAPAAELKEQQSEGAAGAQKAAVEAAARRKDEGASEQEAEEEAERVLREAEEREGQGGNLWAKALGAAGVAATGAAIAAAVTSSGII